ncbi:hypothetical protein QFC21_006160 [Naganishia friedmannii]|uniref:Uncharacterized protein n=1 Tax=Naganishia friedmannii TaxID=89922 RepID=A0ACC2V3Y6_9TREE|nr:hypothetical protein QFC21_006160 [Naganishia friedmannii]
MCGAEYTSQSRRTLGGPEARIQLCQGQTYDITSPIIFTAKGQELSTEGYPVEEELKAKIILRKDWTKGEGLLGNSHRGSIAGEGAAIIGWTAIQFREGDNLSCENAVIEDNRIGPAGEEWDEALDGNDPENSPLGRPLASGLSLACRTSTVQRNSFVDTTDAAIVIYGSPGSLISSNHILSSTHSQMAGILMADIEPFDGDYTNTRVINNTLEADENALMRVAIGLGAAVLSDDMDTVIRGGIVKGNKIKGIGMGYGIAASGLSNFTVLDNESTARHGGKRGARCLVPVELGEEGYDSLTEAEQEHGVIRNPLPTAFLKNEHYIDGGEWQEDFIQGDFSYLVCIDPDAVESESGREPKPVAERKSEEPALTDKVPIDSRKHKVVKAATNNEADDEEVDSTTSGTGHHNAVFDDILSHSQARMLETIASLARSVDLLAGKAALAEVGAGGRPNGKARVNLEEGSGEVLAQLSELSTRVAKLESERTSLRKTMEDLNHELDLFGNNLARTEKQEVQSVDEVLDVLTLNSKRNGKEDVPVSTADGDVNTTTDSWVVPFVYLLGTQVTVAIIGLLWTKCRRRDKGSKGI